MWYHTPMMSEPIESKKVETEAKFIVPDRATFTALKQTAKLGEFQLQPVGTKTVTDRYLDTADRRLFAAGFACRIRLANQKQTLTLKSLTPAEGNIHRRQEISAEVSSERPQAWGQSEAKETVLEIIGEKALQNLFTIHQTRHQFHVLLANEPVIEFSLDEVALNPTGHVDYFELEAELLKAGTEAHLQQFTHALQARWNLPPAGQSKFERALNRQNKTAL